MTTPNRWTIAGAGVLLQLALGGVYAWSVFSRELQRPESAFALTKAQAALPFSVAIGMIVIGSFLGGRLQDARGPRVVAVIGGVCYSAGVLLAGTASGRDQFWLLVLGYGVVGGFGLGLAYIVPVAMLQKWFPDKRGLITGIAVGGFGFGAFLTSPVASWLVGRYPEVPTRAFLWLGTGYLAMTLLGASVFRNPPEGYRVAGAAGRTADAATAPGRDYTPSESLRTRQWYQLTLILTLNVTAGIGLVSVEASAAVDIAGFSVGAAATLTGLMGLFNGAGRVLWGWLSERTGRMPAFVAMLVIQGTCFLALPHASSPAVFVVLAALVYACYGGSFGVMPATAGDYFGLRHAGAVYGLMIAGWSLGGLIGPQLVARLADGGEYARAFTVIAVLAFASTALPLLTRPPVRPLAGPDRVPLAPLGQPAGR